MPEGLFQRGRIAMTLTNGVDAVEIPRIQRAMERPGFLARFFSQEERAYFESRKMAPQTVAGHFAAKEAFSKAMGTGISGFELREAAVVHDERGRPEYCLTGQAARLAEGWRLSLSITHTADTAIAFATAWKED